MPTFLSDPPQWVYLALGGALIVTGAIYYAVSVRGRAADVEVDTATGEAIIG